MIKKKNIIKQEKINIYEIYTSDQNIPNHHLQCSSSMYGIRHHSDTRSSLPGDASQLLPQITYPSHLLPILAVFREASYLLLGTRHNSYSSYLTHVTSPTPILNTRHISYSSYFEHVITPTQKLTTRHISYPLYFLHVTSPTPKFTTRHISYC